MGKQRITLVEAQWENHMPTFKITRGSKRKTYKNVTLSSRCRMTHLCQDLLRQCKGDILLWSWGWSMYFIKGLEETK